MYLKDLFIIQTSQHPVNEGSNYLFKTTGKAEIKRDLKLEKNQSMLSLHNQWSNSQKLISLLLVVKHNDKINDCIVLHFSNMELKWTRQDKCAE